jgi:hypothetical protein
MWPVVKLYWKLLNPPHGAGLSRVGIERLRKRGYWNLQEWIKELNENEPLMTCRENELDTENSAVIAS